MEIITEIFKHVGVYELISFIAAVIFFAARLEENSKSNRELLNTELKHILNIMEINHKNIIHDINRLEKKQEESNKIKERLAMQEVLSADHQTILRDLQAMLHAHIADKHEHN